MFFVLSPHFISLDLLRVMPAQRSPQQKRSLGPLSDVDPELRDPDGNLLLKKDARLKNNERLRQALITLIPAPDIPQAPGHEGHQLGVLQMGVGATSDHTIGCWYNIVSICIAYMNTLSVSIVSAWVLVEIDAALASYVHHRFMMQEIAFGIQSCHTCSQSARNSKR
jgi:hypothetical protein